MKTIQIPYVLFSLAVVVALVLAAFPAPAFALAPTASSATSTGPQVQAVAAPQPEALVCRTTFFWVDHHWVAVRVCHRVDWRS
jgi:hypothetical protein